MQTKVISSIGWAIFTTLIVLSLSGCGGGGGGDVPSITVSGTVTLPASVIDRKWYVAIDDDYDGGNGEITYVSGVITGSTFNYSIDNAPSGDYFIYGEVDMTETLGPWNAGDYVGVGCGTIYSPCKVTIDSSKIVDFTLVVMPDGGDSLISWDANREFSVNSPGGGYRVYYSTNPGFDISTANIVDVPFVSGPAAPTSIVIPLSSGIYYIKVVAYSTLNSAGSQPSQERLIYVP